MDSKESTQCLQERECPKGTIVTWTCAAASDTSVSRLQWQQCRCHCRHCFYTLFCSTKVRLGDQRKHPHRILASTITAIVLHFLAPHSSMSRLPVLTFGPSFGRSHGPTFSSQDIWSFRFPACIFSAPVIVGQTIIFLPCGFFFLSFFFPRLISAVGDWMDVCHTSTHGVALVRI